LHGGPDEHLRADGIDCPEYWLCPGCRYQERIFHVRGDGAGDYLHGRATVTPFTGIRDPCEIADVRSGKDRRIIHSELKPPGLICPMAPRNSAQDYCAPPAREAAAA